MKRRMDRRAFVAGAARGGAGLVILQNSRSVWSYQANEKLNVALVGIAGRGQSFVDTIPKLENVVAACDVNDQRAAASWRKLKDAKKYYDFRKMLTEMEKQIDAVITAAPDHIHAPCTMMAMKLGKHVYTEKPLTRRISEARALREAAAKCKVATQMGNQGTGSEPFRRAVELIQAGAIGEVREVHAWNTNGGTGERELPKGSEPVPDWLQWDLWLGPCPARPFHSQWLQWHAWREFATGQLGNWATHTMNVIFKGLKLDALWKEPAAGERAPKVAIEAEVSGYHKYTFPKSEIIRYDFPARGGLPPVRVNWYNGSGKAPAPRDMIEKLIERKLDWGDAGEKRYQDHAGCILIGTRGVLHSTGHNMTFSLHPDAKFKDFVGPSPTLPRVRGHEQEWLDACKGRGTTMSNFGYAGPHTEFVLLGNVATQFKGKLEYDPVACKIANHAEADAALRCEYREGWAL